MGSFNIIFINRVLRFTDSRSVYWSLALLAFGDAFIIPLPVATLFITFVVIRPEKAIRYVTPVIVGMLTGAIAGYLVGYLTFRGPVNDPNLVLNRVASVIPCLTAENLKKVSDLYLEWKYFVLFFSIITPLPYCLFSIFSGSVGMNIWGFIVSSLAVQLFKFMFLAFLIPGLSERIKLIIYRKFVIRPGIKINN